MSRIFLRALGALTLIALLALPLTASAHGVTQVGDYEIVIGFHGEPAYQSEANGLEFFVTNTKTGEAVKGLEDTLRLEIVYGSSKRELKVETQYGQDGAYIGYVQPTKVGDYTAHIWGTIESTPVDVSMASSPDTFSSIEPKANVAFPSADPTPAELKQSAQLALIVGGVGVVLGLIGLGMGVMGLRARKS